MVETALSYLEGIGQAGFPAALACAAVFLVGAMVFLPRPLICVFSGATVGLWAIPVAILASTAGAMLALLVGRRLLRPRFAAALAERPRLSAIVAAVEAEGWRVVALLRVSSPLPASFQNYLYGVTNIDIWQFGFATLIGCTPSVVTFIYLGAALKSSLDAGTLAEARLVLAAAGCVLMGVVVALVARRMRPLYAGAVRQPALTRRSPR